MRRYLLILAALVAALIGVVVLAVFRSPTLGLDLQGGLEVVLEARPEEGRQLTKEDLDRSVEIIRSRVDKLGVGEPEIREQGSNQISVSLPGVFDTARAASIIGQTAQLEMFDVEKDVVSESKDPQGQIRASAQLLPLLTAEDKLKDHVQALIVAEQKRQAEEEARRKAEEERLAREAGLERQRLAEEAARVALEAALAVERQRQKEEAERQQGKYARQTLCGFPAKKYNDSSNKRNKNL